MAVDLTPFFHEHEFYGPQNTAMAAWLSDKPQEAWLHVARHLNWDMAMPVMQWMVEQPSCDLAVAAHFFWEFGLPWSHQREANSLYTEAELATTVALQLGEAIIRRARGRGFGSIGLQQPTTEVERNASAARRDPASLGFIDLPAVLLGPFETFEADPPPAFDPTQNDELRSLFNGLGTGFGT